MIITKKTQFYRRFRMLLMISGAVLGLTAACSSGNNAPPVSPPAPPPPPAPLTIAGVVTDGPVFGGTLFVFAAADVQAALDSVDPDGDRLAALNAASAIGAITRDPADEDQYLFIVPAEFANTPER